MSAAELYVTAAAGRLPARLGLPLRVSGTRVWSAYAVVRRAWRTAHRVRRWR